MNLVCAMKHCAQKGHYLWACGPGGTKPPLAWLHQVCSCGETPLSPTTARKKLWIWLGVRKQFPCSSLMFPLLRGLQSWCLSVICSAEAAEFASAPAFLGLVYGRLGCALYCPGVGHCPRLKIARDLLQSTLYIYPHRYPLAIYDLYKVLLNASPTPAPHWNQLKLVVFLCFHLWRCFFFLCCQKYSLV